MSLADSIRRRTDEWEEKKKQEGRAEGRVEERGELLREFTAAQQEGRLDELLDSYNRQANGHHNGQEPENHA